MVCGPRATGTAPNRGADSSLSRQVTCAGLHNTPRCGATTPARGRRAAAGTCSYRSSSFRGRHLCVTVSNGSKWRMARWLDNSAEVEVPVPLEVCWSLWEDRERIPQWMPWIKTVTVLPEEPRLSRWLLSTHQFGRDWEFSWLARNLTPIKNQKIHWVAEPGSASYGISINNRGQVRFVRRPNGCRVTLSISYEVPDALAPFANALTPLVENIIGADMLKFKDYAVAYAQAAQATQKTT